MTPVNIPDLIQKCCGYGQLWPLRPACSQNHAGSDFPHPTRVCSFKGDLDHIVQNQPGSNLDGLVRFQPNGSCPEASQCVIIIRPGSGRMQPVYYQFPTFRLSYVLLHGTYGLDHTVQNQPGPDLVLADCVKFLVKWIWSGSKLVCKNHPARFWPTLPRSRSDVNRIWRVYWDCTTHCSLMIFVRHVSINLCMRSSPLSCISRPTCCSCKWMTTATTAQVSTILNDSAHPLYTDFGNSSMERSGRLNGKMWKTKWKDVED